MNSITKFHSSFHHIAQNLNKSDQPLSEIQKLGVTSKSIKTEWDGMSFLKKHFHEMRKEKGTENSPVPLNYRHDIQMMNDAVGKLKSNYKKRFASSKASNLIQRIVFFFKRTLINIQAWSMRRTIKSCIKHLTPITSHQNETAKRILQSEKELDTNWHLKDYFGHIYVLTLDKQSKRYKNLTQSAKTVNLKEEDWEVVPGVKSQDVPEQAWKRMRKYTTFNRPLTDKEKKDRPGQTACFRAHYNIIKDAKEKFDRAKSKVENLNKQYLEANGETKTRLKAELDKAQKDLKSRSSILVMEDNNGFGRVKGDKILLENVGRRFHETMKDLPPDWEMFYFISNPVFYKGKPWRAHPKGLKSTKHLKRLFNGLMTKCFAVNFTAFDVIAKHLAKVEEGRTERLMFVDHELRTLQTDLKAYIASPALCYRDKGASMVGSHELEKKHWQLDC